MPRIACLMMLRDEVLLLEPWLRYHGYLFGYENLYVYDNGSVSENVRDVLQRFAAAGVNVDVSHKEKDDFVGKGEIIGAKIKAFQESGSYDIALAVDCDEFIALAGPAGPSISRNQILTEIERIYQAGVICQMQKCFYSVPGYLDQFWLAGHRRCIAPVRLFKEIDHGFHWVNMEDRAQYGATQFTYIHLHYKPFADLVTGARQKLAAFMDITDLETLKTFTGVGRHTVRYLFMTPEAYYRERPDGLPFISFGGFLRALELSMDFAATRNAWEAGRPATGHGNPAVLDLEATPFAAAAYLAANPDLADVPNLFYHYVEQGFAEGRPIRPANPREAAWRAMQEGRYAEVVPLWAEYRLLRPDDPEGYDAAVIACRNAGLDPAEIIDAARARFPDFFASLMSPA
jgi:hypothetical protein